MVCRDRGQETEPFPEHLRPPVGMASVHSNQPTTPNLFKHAVAVAVAVVAVVAVAVAVG